MRFGHIPDGDDLFRHSIKPLSFKAGIFVSQKFIMLKQEPDGSLLGSLAWERYVPAIEHVHGYGCRVAFRMNEKKRAEGKLKEKDRRVYCGAYGLKGEAVRKLATTSNLDEILSADIIHHIEEGEIAHTDLRIFLKPGIVDIEDTKTAIVDRLWNACSGPLRHICDHDKDIKSHPSSSLLTAPCGEYSDTRSSFVRRWYILRFRIYYWVWRKFFNNADSPQHLSDTTRSAG